MKEEGKPGDVEKELKEEGKPEDVEKGKERKRRN